MYQLISLCIFAAAAGAISLPQVLDRTHKAPLLTTGFSDVITGSYIVAFADNTEESGIDEHLISLERYSLVGTVSRFNLGSFKGYVGEFSTKALEIIRSMPSVAYVEQDQIMYAVELQNNAPWGLARVSHRERLDSATRRQYLFESGGGEGVNAYVLDTGINTEHVDFGGRARWGATMPERSSDSDRHGHGTHCAGTIAGSRYGIAKKANIIAVKVLGDDASGSTSDIVRGINWVVQDHHQQKENAKQQGKPFKGSVANLSLGGGYSRSMNRAVNSAVEAGITVVVAAGNENSDACDVSPASAKYAITVAASTIDDKRASYSNYGKCVDLFAPGSDIKSTYIGSDRATTVMSGTSMASPHIAGLSAYLMSLSTADLAPKDIKDILVQNSTRNALTDVPSDTPNLLAWSNPPSELKSLELNNESLSLDILLRKLVVL